MAKSKSTLEIDGKNKGAINSINEVTSKLGRAVSDVQKAGTGLTGALSGFSSILTNLPFLAAAAATGLVAGFHMMIKSSIDMAESLEKMSQRAGVSVEFLSTLRHATELAGTEIGVMEKALQRLSRNMFDVSNGVGQTSKYAFDQLGISVVDATGKLRKTEDVIYQVADKYAQLKDGSMKTATALAIFGRAGADLIPMLNQGSEGLKKTQEQAKKLGLEISTNTAKQAALFKDNLTVLKASMTGIANVAAASLLPNLISISQAFIMMTSNSASAGQVMSVLGGLAKILVTFFGALAAGIYAAGSIMGTFMATTIKFLSLDFKGAAFVWNKGFKDLKTFALDAGKAFDALWKSGGKYDDLVKQIKENQALEVQKAELEKLKKEWDSLSKTLMNDIAKNSLPAISYQIKIIDDKFSEYTSKFPGHVELIKQWRESMIAAAVDIDKTLESLKKSDENILPEVNTDMNVIDPAFMEQLKKQNDQQIAESTRLTTAELANIAIRKQATSDMFDNMAGAADNFYQISGNQSKAFFAVYKAFAIAKAGIDTYNAAIAAYESMVGIPFIGPGLAVAAAAAATAFGLSNIARIASMQPGSGVSGVSAGSQPSAAPSPGTVNNSSDNRRVQYTINFYGDSSNVSDKDKLARDLIDSINKATEDGLILNNS